MALTVLGKGRWDLWKVSFDAVDSNLLPSDAAPTYKISIKLAFQMNDRE